MGADTNTITRKYAAEAIVFMPYEGGVEITPFEVDER